MGLDRVHDSRSEALSVERDGGGISLQLVALGQPLENLIRPIAIGRKNWLFTGSERAGKRAAAIQTLIGTAKLNGLDAAAWLRDTLEKLPACLNNEIDSLLPLRTEPLHPSTS